MNLKLGYDHSNMKTLVVYFSRMGHSKKVAELLKEQLNADVEELQMIAPYPDDGKPHYMKFGFQAMLGFKPELKPLGVTLDDYDLVIIGSPTWNWRISPPVLSFITKYPLTGKKVALFVTAGGDGVKCLGRFKTKMQGSQIISTFVARDSEKDSLPVRLVTWKEQLKSHFN